ncbi:allene oxide synthase-lipoxygenase protein-like [Mercenaria mercenaria]|uniref:allene oxide synthase-lipoxygenase protein-like n=1 Tax=Mercenaria mercenaria TaxID=6596 RepID=UPI00234EC527|nr:allene oxide synthase-lipoxygenase protein-like [Mercenaria mercenaria]
MIDDLSLPHLSSREEDRQRELEEKRKEYQLTEERLAGCPPLVKHMPSDEKFTFNREFDIKAKVAALTVVSTVKEAFTGAFEDIDDIKSVYGPIFREPSNLNRWRDDVLFGMQRLMCVNPDVISLCTAIPEKLNVNDQILNPFLEGKTLNQALEEKKIFIIDYEILDGLPTKQGFVISSPVALFYQRNDGKIVPIAIQLLQKPGTDNPVFLPSDPPNKWILAKFWFNVADSNYHQSVTHLGFTHLKMEGIAVCTHRQIHKNHPIFKLLMPHFLYLIAINDIGIPVLLIDEDAFVPKTLNIGKKGMIELIKRKNKTWRLNVEGTLPNDLKERGVDDPALLPHYYYRNDAKELYDAIFSYVQKYLDLYYTSEEDVIKDYELQKWRQELTAPVKDQGLGILGVFGENGKFTNKEQVCFTLASIIFTCSGQHAAVNFRQYEDYGYPPNYPGNLRGRPPTNKDEIDDAELLRSLPEKTTTYDAMVITSVLSTNDMNALGDFEVQYITDEKALKVVKTFRADLARIAKRNKEKNKKARLENYWCLDPDRVPNSISI